jgi:hypothetical protein
MLIFPEAELSMLTIHEVECIPWGRCIEGSDLEDVHAGVAWEISQGLVER